MRALSIAINFVSVIVNRIETFVRWNDSNAGQPWH